MAKSKSVGVVVSVTLFVIGLLFGFFLGRENAFKVAELKARSDVKTVLENAFPPPPAEFLSLSGKIIDVVGGTIKLEIDDPDDYIPHADQSPRKKLTRFVDIDGLTKYTKVDYTQVSSTGDPTRIKISFAEFKVGDIVTVRSTKNIKYVGRFTASEIENVIL